jgi:CRP-like cAMP-binding protein
MAALTSRIDDAQGARSGRLEALLEQNLPGARNASIRHLLKTVHRARYAKGEVMFQQGRPVALSLFVSGYGSFLRTTVTGQQVTVGIAAQGQMYGLTAISSTISSVDLVALTEAEVATWPGATLRQLVAMDPDLALDLIDRLSMFMMVLTRKMDGFLHQDARQRVLRVLARHQDLFFAEPPVLNRSHLPGLVGTSREMTGRVLRDLERDGTIVRVGRTGLRLLNPASLESGTAEDLQRRVS